MYKKRKLFQQVGIALLMSFSSTALFATGVAGELVDSGGLMLTPNVSYNTATLRISSDNYDATVNFVMGDAIQVNTGGFADGAYSYELALVINSATNVPNGSSSHLNGGFIVKNGIASEDNDATQAAKAQAERIDILSSQPLTLDSEK